MKRKEQLGQLKDMSVEELKDQAEALKESLFRLKFRKTLGMGEVVKDIRGEMNKIRLANLAISRFEAAELV